MMIPPPYSALGFPQWGECQAKHMGEIFRDDIAMEVIHVIAPKYTRVWGKENAFTSQL